MATTTDRNTVNITQWLYSPGLFYAMVGDVQRVAPRWTGLSVPRYAVMDKVPAAVGKLWVQGRHFAVHDLA